LTCADCATPLAWAFSVIISLFARPCYLLFDEATLVFGWLGGRRHMPLQA
jgi:hypothetical protein